MESKNHWEHVYETKNSTQVSWFQEHASESMDLIRQSGVPKSGAIIDVGGGASTLVDDLLESGYSDVSVLDISDAALAVAKQRLGAHADDVTWLADDITQVELAPFAYDLWHDRAVFHFLTDAKSREAYVDAVIRSVKPGGIVIVATFADDGPDQCSGLPVVRYRPDTLHAEFGARFTLVKHEREEHNTPAGKVQKFVYCLCRKE